MKTYLFCDVLLLCAVTVWPSCEQAASQSLTYVPNLAIDCKIVSHLHPEITYGAKQGFPRRHGRALVR
jgi:hypothetical protein